jgi:hypothetical protein
MALGWNDFPHPVHRKYILSHEAILFLKLAGKMPKNVFQPRIIASVPLELLTQA